MNNTWSYILNVLGSGLYWGKSQEQIQHAIKQAEKDGQLDAAKHLRIILKERNIVWCEKEKPISSD